MRPKPPPDYLAGYSPALRQQVQDLIEQGRFAEVLRRRYPRPHAVRSDAALYDYVQALKATHLRNAAPISKVCYDSRIHVIRNALGTHTTISRVQGAKLTAKREIHIATVFRDVPEEFLRMIVVHELAHLRERDHDKAFYQLCLHMEPHYHQYEFDLRAYLTWRETTSAGLWPALPR
ncbi:MAG: M48 family metallopeptidase [Proteobacteria bacterium]|nr:M48 family metallopeptidase [Pseudomonadota bacterium]MBS0554451.1 M48 family metallopeptidase [Pseudomonadota bacterium]